MTDYPLQLGLLDTPRTNTQAGAILAHLRQGYSITPALALERFGCFRLAARILDIRKVLRPDEHIVVTRRAAPGGAIVACYWLAGGL